MQDDHEDPPRTKQSLSRTMAFNFGSSPGPAFGAPAPAPNQVVMKVSEYKRIDFQKIESLVHLPSPAFAAPNQSLRQQLSSSRRITYNDNEAILSQHMLENIFSLADTFLITEEYAIQLYAAAGGRSLEDAMALYISETTEPLKRLLIAFQSQNFELTNQLMGPSHRIFSKLIDYVRNLTNAIGSRRGVEFWIAQRERAALVLFFAAYSTQLESQEVASILNLIQDLHISKQDPLQNTPSAYKNEHHEIRSSGTFSSALPPLEAKGRKEWEEELAENLYQTGQPQLLRSVSFLTMAAVASLTVKHKLMDRVSNESRENSIDPHTLQSIFMSQDGWKGREELWGFLCASFAKFQHHRDLPYTFCVEAPALNKSFSFARYSLMPALWAESDPDAPVQSSDCLFDVLSDLMVDYLDLLSTSGRLPISREAWEKEQKDDLELRRTAQQQQRDFQAWSGTKENIESVPKSVDLLRRPDCLDDLIMFSVEVGLLGASHAFKFWDTVIESEGNLSLVPSQSFLNIERLTSQDDSLRPVYLSFVAMLSSAVSQEVDVNGALNVHKLIIEAEYRESDTLNVFKSRPTYSGIIEVLRWYVQELSLEYSEGSTNTSKKYVKSDGVGSTAYYYRDRNISIGSSVETSKSETKPSTKVRELDDDSSFILLAYLRIITNVSKGWPEARRQILGVRLPIQGSSGRDIIGEDSALMILYSLLTGPLTPRLRGAVFESLASLLCLEDVPDIYQSEMQKYVLEAWELLDACQILPIRLLDLYRRDGSIGQVGLRFPPSSMTLAGNISTDCWLPNDQKYAILYEIEYVESRLGQYLSVAGFLGLLQSLFSSGVHPEDLGKKGGRFRLGPSPYLEFVSNYLLPRVTGQFDSAPPLEFQSSKERAKLCTLAMRVISSVLSRYVIPVTKTEPRSPKRLKSTNNFQEVCQAAKRLGGVDLVIRAVAVSPRKGIQDGVDKQSEADFSPQPMTFTIPAENGRESKPISNTPERHLKSPGFTCLVGIFTSGGSIMMSIIHILTNIAAMDCSDCDRLALSRALFGFLGPSYELKAKWNKSSSKVGLEDFITSLSSEEGSNSSAMAVTWRDQLVQCSLEVLCCAMVREEVMIQASMPFHTPSRFLPSLEFTGRVPTGLSFVDLHFSDFSTLLKHAESQFGTLSSIALLVAKKSSCESLEVAIASLACSILFYIDLRSPHNTGLPSSMSPQTRKMLPLLFGERICRSLQSKSEDSVALVRFILRKLLEGLRVDVYPSLMSSILLGLNPAPASFDCFDAILAQILDSSDLPSSRYSEVSVMMFEVIYRSGLVRSFEKEHLSMVVALSDKLWKRKFWEECLYCVLGDVERDPIPNAFHCLSWILMAMANDISLLGLRPQLVQSLTELSGGRGAYHAGSLEQFNILLFSSENMNKMIECIPTAQLEVGSPGYEPPSSVLQSAKFKAEHLPEICGEIEMIEIEKLETILKSLESLSTDNIESVIKWAGTWNKALSIQCGGVHFTYALLSLMTSFEGIMRNAQFDNSLAKDFSHTLQRLVDRLTSSLRSSSETQEMTFVSFNISRLILACTNLISSINYSEVSKSTCSDVAILISRVGGASRRLDSVPENMEVIGLLSASLGRLLDKVDIVTADQRGLLMATHTLIRVASCSSSHTENKGKAQKYVAQTRACLSILFEKLEGDKDSESFFLSFLESNEPHLKSLLTCLTSLDDTAAALCQSIASTPWGASFLLDLGIMDQLFISSRKYLQEELENSESLSRQKDAGPLVTPPFVLPYIQLLSAFIAISESGPKAPDTVRKAFDVLDNLSATADRLTKTFPLEGDILCAYIKCLAQAHFVLESSSLKRSGSGYASVRPVSCSTSLCGFSVFLAESPLPEYIIGKVPTELLSSEYESVSGVFVSAKKMNAKSWWDSLMLTKKPEGLNLFERNLCDEVCFYSSQGVELAVKGLSIALSNHRSIQLLDPMSICRAICQCAAAFVVTASTSRKVLRSQIVSLLTELLLVSSLYVRIRKDDEGTAMSDRALVSRSFSFTLDYTRLDTMGLKTDATNDENAHAFIQQLARELRKEL